MSLQQYFKSIESVASHTVSTPPRAAAHSPLPLTPPPTTLKDPAPGTWRGALKELRIDTQRSRELGDDDDMELTPDSMSARVAAHEEKEGYDSAIGMSPPREKNKRGSYGGLGMGMERKLPPVRKSTIDGLDFGRMEERVH
jgi:hypothetical protein